MKKKMFEKNTMGAMGILENGMWVDFVENNERARRMGYGRLIDQDWDYWSRLSERTLSSVISSAVRDALMLFSVSPLELPNRIARSLVPPVLHKFRVIHVDLLGPCLALSLLTSLMICGQTDKEHAIQAQNAVFLFSLLFPIFIYSVLRCFHAAITFMQLLTLLGYSLFGPILTLSVSFLIDQEKSNAVFFMCLAVFGGLSTLRVVLVILASLRVPIARLIICSSVAIIQLLFVVFLHFAYLHPTFVYGHARSRNIAN